MQVNFKYVIEQLSAKSTVDSVRLNMIQDFTVVFPSIDEQQSIISYLKSKLSQITNAVALAERQIALLQERKQIIINDVVTGKINII